MSDVNSKVCKSNQEVKRAMAILEVLDEFVVNYYSSLKDDESRSALDTIQNNLYTVEELLKSASNTLENLDAITTGCPLISTSNPIKCPNISKNLGKKFPKGKN